MLSSRPLALNADGPIHTKTPGRALKGRNALQENIYRGPMTIHAKSKGALTPHRPLTSRAQKTLRDGAKPAITVTVSRPLGDKTPAPNRIAAASPFQTPSPLAGKLAQLSLHPAQPTLVGSPGALLRPSSARKSLRIPRTSGSGKFEFKTPITRGNHWDVSDGDVDMDGNGEAEVGTEEKGAEQEEDYDEIEYMPPTAIIPPYEPPFEMPDYTVVGQNILELAFSAKFDDSADLYYAADIEIEIDPQEVWQASGFASSPSKWEKLRLPELEDDSPLSRIKTAAPTSSRAPSAPRPPAATARPTTRSTTATRPVPARSTAAVASSSRPPTRATPATGIPSRPASSSSRTLRANSASRPPLSRPGTSAAVAASTTTATTAATNAPRPATATATATARPTTSASTRMTTRSGAQKSAPLTSQTAAAVGNTTATRRAPTASAASAVRRAVPSSTSGGTAGAMAPRTRAAPALSRAASTAKAAASRTAKEDDVLLVFADGAGTVSGLGEDFVFDV